MGRMNDAMRRLDDLVGEWDVTMTHAWFLESLETEIPGTARMEWLADAFLVIRIEVKGTSIPDFEDASRSEFVIGRTDARDRYLALYHDGRDVYRVFDVTVTDGEWTFLREDPDFHQRMVMRFSRDRIEMRADASEDAGQTWRKDLDYILVRRD
jgi:hypothetical protein